MNKITFICDRCGDEQEGFCDEHFTAGYYNVGDGSPWHRFARAMETMLCDHCMWSDSEYQKIYAHDAEARAWRESQG